jgi:hypothetical protein
VFVGKGTAFEDQNGLIMKDVPDGTSNTLLIIEGGKPAPWSKPEELPYDPGKPLPPLDSPFKLVTRIALMSGSVRALPKDFGEPNWRALITRNGNEPISQAIWGF